MLPTLLTIALLHWLVMLTPGANMLVITSLAAHESRGTASVAALGVAAVAAMWASLAVLGVNAVFAAHPAFRLALQVAGGLYLLHVALRLWRSGVPVAARADLRLSPLAAFRLGAFTNLMNPKSALFFGSVFATALPAHPSPALLAASVALVLADALAWHLFLAVAFSQPRVQAAYARRRLAASRVAGALVSAFGARLLVAAASEWRSR